MARNVAVCGGVVVTGNIPGNCVAYGNPCRPARTITDKDSKLYLL